MASCDIAIIGGGIMGSSVAYHLLKQDRSLRVAVVEKDPTYRRASSALSMGNARIQFRLTQNIEISKYTLRVLPRFAAEMEVDGHRPDLSFKQEGNLFLVNENAVDAAREAVDLQRRMGCHVEWWTDRDIEQRFPLLRLEELAGGTFGAEDGHLDGYAFLMGYRHKAASLGALLLNGEVCRIRRKGGRVTGLDLTEGDHLESAVVVNCAGAWAAKVCESAGIELPVVPVQRQVFVIDPAIRPASPLPLTSLPTGLYLRSEGRDRILVGKSLPDDRVGFDLRWEEKRFTEMLWPELVGLVPAFDRLRVERGWAGLYAVNSLDGNAILGEWPELAGLFLACGFSGHGLQQAPAVGRYLAEQILGRAHALDLSSFGADRILQRRPIVETVSL